jgi:UDP-N-acetylmuramate--alanine ligase
MQIAGARVHLIGVGGAGMSGLARLLAGAGARLSGSDKVETAVVARLREEGLHVWSGCRPDLLEGENGYVIRSAAVPDEDPEHRDCVGRGFTSLLYAEAVGRISEGRRTLAIAGTHGKTTTTGLTVAAARGAGIDPSHLIGGEIPELGGNGHGGADDVFIVEACEFNRSFHNLRPTAAAVLNVDHDHFDCYPSARELHEAFAGYLARVRPHGTVLIEESVPARMLEQLDPSVRVLRVGSGLFARVRAVDVRDDLGRYSFVPVLEGRRGPRVQLLQPGRFQVQNALFALGLVTAVGGDLDLACRGLDGFGGVRRRFEVHAGRHGGQLVNDYAHHPEEIRVVIQAARRRFPGRTVFVVFQPHQHSRTLHLMDDFVAALAEADHCLIAEIYGARESHEIRSAVCANDLVERIRARGIRCDVAGPLEDIPTRVVGLRHPADLLLVLGAGDIDLVVDELVAAI